MAAQTVTGYSNVSCNFQQFATIVTSQSLMGLITQAVQYVTGTGVIYGVNQLYAATITLASTTQTIHFGDASALDPSGNTLAMRRIRELIIQNVNTTFSQPLKVSTSAAQGIPWLPASTGPLYVQSGNATGNGGILRISDPTSFGSAVGNVVGAVTDGILLDSVSATVTFNIVVLGNTVA